MTVRVDPIASRSSSVRSARTWITHVDDADKVVWPAGEIRELTPEDKRAWAKDFPRVLAGALKGIGVNAIVPARARRDLDEIVAASETRAFAPSALFTSPAKFLRDKGVDVTQLRFKVDTFWPNGFTIAYANADAGHVDLAVTNDEPPQAWLRDVSIKAPLAGNGLGVILYAAAAQQLYTERGAVLRTSPTMSMPAFELWERLVDCGLARKHVEDGVLVASIREDVLRSGKLRAVAAFVDERLR